MCFLNFKFVSKQKTTQPVFETTKDLEKTRIALLRVTPHHDMSGEGCQVKVIYRVKQAFQNVQARQPPHLFSGMLRALVVSCPPFSIAPVTSVCESKTQTCRRTSMPKHVSIPPGRNTHAKTCQNKHAKTWQWST